MTKLLDSAAVGSRDGEDAKEILRAYIATTPAMVLSHTLGAAPKQQPKGTGAGDRLVEPR